jgi:hypothetical protein
MRKLFLTGLLVAAGMACADDDPPSRVARLNFVDGAVSFQATGQDDWSEAVVNYPLTTGDRLWADENSHAELHIGSAAIRLDSHTALAFLNLDDRMTQVRLSDGTINITIRRLDSDESYEIDTPNGAVTLVRPGKYRIDADPERETTTVTVRGGDAEITAGGQAFPVHARQSAFITGTDAPSTEVREALSSDNFDRWWQTRDDREDRRPPPRYVSRDMVGYEDLDEYGYWRDEPGYGNVWVPRTVAAGWAPYHDGHWAMVEPWGWTWIDDAPWGFAPFHYGRWAYARGNWCWIPGPVSVRPVYAPALVAWVGGEHWGVSLGFGGGGGVGWFPLGPREIYRPSYRVSETYVNRVNVTNITNITNVNVTNVNVNNVRYVNQNAPGAVTAVSRTDFAQSRQVARVAVRVPPSAIASAQVTTQTTPIPRSQAIMARPEGRALVARPPQSVVNTPVVTRTPPPAATQTLARPTNAQIYRPAAGNQPVQANRPAAGNQPVQANRPGQPTPVYQPPAAQARPQSERTDRPAAAPPRPQSEPYRPPAAAQERPQSERTDRPPAAQPRPQSEPYRPPAAAQDRPQNDRTDRPSAPRPQSDPSYRPPAAQQRPPSQSEPTYRPVAPSNRPAPAEARPQNQPHNHPDRPPEVQRGRQTEDRRPPAKDKEKPKDH